MSNNQIAVFEQTLQKEMPNISRSLPQHISPARFERVVVTSVANNDRLRAADPVKVVNAAAKIAALGLLTDPHLGEAYLVPDFRGDVQARIGYRGLIKLARQSGQISSIYAHEVCENDHIDCVLGDSKRLDHRPKLFGDRGQVVGYYAVFKTKDGDTDFEPMTIDQINEIRDRSDGWKAFRAGKIKDTPWASSYDEMAKKTAIRRLLKRAPASPELEEVLRLENEEDSREYSGRGLKDVTPAATALAAVLPALTGKYAIVDENGVVTASNDRVSALLPILAEMPWTQELAELNRDVVMEALNAASEAAKTSGNAKVKALHTQAQEVARTVLDLLGESDVADDDGMVEEPEHETEAA